MTIQKTTKIALFLVLIAVAAPLCWSAANNLNPETPIGSLALLYAEGSADQAPRILASLYRKDLLELALIGHKESQRFPNLYQDAMRELFRQKEKFQQLLQQHNGDVKAALFDAAKNNKPWAIDYLVQNGANVNARNHYGQTALMQAAGWGHEAIVAQLLANRANVNEKANRGYTALIYAASNGHGTVVAQLLVAGAIVDETNEGGKTALMCAASLGREAVVAQLLAAGADVNARDNNNDTVLMEAASLGREAVVAQLLVAGADVNPKDNDGDTALSLAESAVNDNRYSQARRDGARAVVDLLTKGR